ncbi:DUF3139 domain-containing protein [Brochothrix thermosphacta]|uniref:DUF3139 domain-containing protein n=1 Tax=Brochothrix thermosphacta TaxID=2756 RepID=A0A2X0S2B2_BROTH|nr:DUF3139 domain-containing protein [Brochothrix thermosphacta]ODJ47769.1 hypothetical protein BFR38_07010 [Brochothrix thermosphacta]ODJ50715.1 hypothetical protein BFR40_09335 [Brochothrix thermosphacta]ODJ60167.1 hypothetical protein BFR44_03765 [Brochothrix thermosphacta]ODJ61770.1 hypothetical protein BFR42_00245 [Brochothrix thermosphacta]SPP26902.1 conserved hypothetical protein [Brochothrix thermosphacta]
MKKFIIIGSILIISALSVTTYYFYQKHVAEREIDLYITDYGIPSKEISSENFGFAFKYGHFYKTIIVENEPDNYYGFSYDSKNKSVDFEGNVHGNVVDFDSPLISKLKYQPSEKVKNMER